MFNLLSELDRQVKAVRSFGGMGTMAGKMGEVADRPSVARDKAAADQMEWRSSTHRGSSTHHTLHRAKRHIYSDDSSFHTDVRLLDIYYLMTRHDAAPEEGAHPDAILFEAQLLENKTCCILFTRSGFQVLDEAMVKGDLDTYIIQRITREDNNEQAIYETIEALLTTHSPLYRQRFHQAITERLTTISTRK